MNGLPSLFNSVFQHQLLSCESHITKLSFSPFDTHTHVHAEYTDSKATYLLFHISVSGFDGNIDSQGELILQDSFQVWDPKTLIRKGRDRHLFLFEMSLVFSKEVKDSNGRSKYLFKSKLFVSDALVYGLFVFWFRLRQLRRQYM